MPKHLLAIDDEQVIRDLLCEALTSVGYRVTAASTPAEAMQVVKADPPDLVLTDLQLVDSDGFAVIEQVKAVNARIPIVVLTGVLMDAAEIPAGMAKLIAGYLPKTSSLEEIVREVKKWVA